MQFNYVCRGFYFFGKNYFSIYFQKQHCIVDGFRLSVLLIQKYSLVNFTDLLDCLILQVPALSTSLLSPIHSHVYIIILIFIIKFLLWQNSNSNFLFLCLFVFFLVAKVYKFQLAIMFCPRNCLPFMCTSANSCKTWSKCC